MIRSVWVLGKGACLTDGQFLLDYRRLRLTLDGARLPDDPREGVRRLYHACGADYFMFTKFMNQTVPNMGLLALQRLHSAHLIPEQRTLSVSASTMARTVTATFCCRAYSHTLVYQGVERVRIVFDLRTYQYTARTCSI